MYLSALQKIILSILFCAVLERGLTLSRCSANVCKCSGHAARLYWAPTHWCILIWKHCPSLGLWWWHLEGHRCEVSGLPTIPWKWEQKDPLKRKCFPLGHRWLIRSIF